MFVVKDKVVYTPGVVGGGSPDDTILEGVTRDCLITLCKDKVFIYCICVCVCVCVTVRVSVQLPHHALQGQGVCGSIRDTEYWRFYIPAEIPSYVHVSHTCTIHTLHHL